MRRIIAVTLALTVLSSTWLLGSEGATKAKKAVKKPAPPPASAQMQKMQDQLNQQQQQINQLQQQLQQSNQQLQSAQGQIQSSVMKATQDAAAAQQAASAAQQTANSLNSSVTDLKMCCADLTKSVTVLQKDVKELLNPLAIRYKGVMITPGGFADFGAAWRSRNDTSSLSSNFGGLPLNGTPNASFSEYRTDARNSRVQFKFEGKPNDNVKLTGFIMGDFYGTADPSTNANQVNSWLFRIREAWVMAQMKSGFFFAGGQMYSLWTPGRKGVLPDGMMLPLAYEGNEIIGMPYERGAQFRIGKKFNAHISAAIEIDQPELASVSSNLTPSALLGTQNSGTDFPVGNNLPVACCNQTFLIYPGNSQTGVGGAGATSASGNLAAGAAATMVSPVAGLQSINGGLAANPVPDLVAKVAWDSPTSTAHFEVRGLARFIRSGVALNANGSPVNTNGSGQKAIETTSTMIPTLTGGLPTATAYKSVDMNWTYGWGLGISAVAPVTKKVDFILNANAGAGSNARYNPGGGNSADFTIGVDNSGTYMVKPVRGYTGIAGLEMHPAPKWDWYLYGGNEYYQRTNCGPLYSDPYGQLNAGTGGTAAGTCMGYGLPKTATSNPSNTSPNRDLWEGTVGYIYRIWRGNFGTFQTMGEYQYIHRAVWQDASTAVSSSQFKGSYSVADLALRYILP
jgi:hypothetical protein